MEFFAGANCETNLADAPRYFAWYELITTDVAGASTFYRDVVGWGTQEASTPKLPYILFMTGADPAAGLMELPEEGLRMGARPRWMGYVAVENVHASVDRIKRLGGSVYVPPTDTNIGQISVVADPSSANFALIDRLRIRPQDPGEMSKMGRVGWHELLAADLGKEFAFYSKLFGWQKVDDGPGSLADHHAFSAGGQVIGGVLAKRAAEPFPFWLFYFNVDDLDAAVERVEAGGGMASRNEEELSSGLSVARCTDPQGALFALQGKQSHTRRLGWSTQWRGFSSQGQLVSPKRRRGTIAKS